MPGDTGEEDSVSYMSEDLQIADIKKVSDSGKLKSSILYKFLNLVSSDGFPKWACIVMTENAEA